MASSIVPPFFGLSKPEEENLSEKSWQWKYFSVQKCRPELQRNHGFPELNPKIINLKRVSRTSLTYIHKNG